MDENATTIIIIFPTNPPCCVAPFINNRIKITRYGVLYQHRQLAQSLNGPLPLLLLLFRMENWISRNCWISSADRTKLPLLLLSTELNFHSNGAFVCQRGSSAFETLNIQTQLWCKINNCNCRSSFHSAPHPAWHEQRSTRAQFKNSSLFFSSYSLIDSVAAAVVVKTGTTTTRIISKTATWSRRPGSQQMQCNLCNNTRQFGFRLILFTQHFSLSHLLLLLCVHTTMSLRGYHPPQRCESESHRTG